VSRRDAVEQTPELVFPHTYKVRVIDEIPNVDPYRVFRFVGKGRTVDEPAVLVRFTPERSPTWTGSFVHGYGSPPAMSGIYSWYRPSDVLIVEGGQGYVIDVNEPQKCEPIPEFPITALIQDLATGLNVIADFNRVAAYDASGRRWSLRVSADGVDMTLKEGQIIAHGCSLPDKSITSVIDLRTGQVISDRSS